MNREQRAQRIVHNMFWDEDARRWLETWSLTEAEAESVILNDPRPTLDPSSTDRGYPIVRFRVGDVIVVIGLRVPERPKVLGIYKFIPGQETHSERTAGTGGESNIPKTNRQLRQWILGYGYKLEAANHDKVYDPENGSVIYTLPGTPSDHRTLANCWKGFLRAHAKYEANKKLRKDA